ncbi:MAG: PIN domain-containing protein [Candidatus Competibacteraceae bacterium]|nr:PIN domain-containing protein [Candidatus Competibacteraceae bacterium]MBK8898895.1 PIN domain-containing protein [Candidatus Competibacteraceae bacterium]MBK8963959.1 PIN domain-containing protein [Candidatus Competibacteraceae bacterium]MBK9951898.1 PIN domain-containing protein [Candidatus Competibacteraceae bacterium]
MIRVYLDNCCLQRHLDNQTHPRIRVETEALFALLAAVSAKEIVLFSSEALTYEISSIPDETRRMETFAVLSLASEYLQVTDEVETLALALEDQGLQTMDALHLALASTAKADYFCTCDDRLLRKVQSISILDCKVITLLNSIPEIVK